METTSLALSSICKILELDFIELWFEVHGTFNRIVRINSSNGIMMRTDDAYNEFLIKKCKQVKQVPPHLSWEVNNSGNIFNQRTIMTYLLPTSNEEIHYVKQEFLTDVRLFLLGGSIRLINHDELRTKYLRSLSISLYISIFGIDKFDPEGNLEVSIERMQTLTDLEYNDNGKSDLSKNEGKEEMTFEIDFYSKSIRSSSSGSTAHNSNSTDNNSNFHFPINKIPIRSTSSRELDINEIENITHITNGTNSNIFMGILKGEQVIIKMIAIELSNDELVLSEFNMEINILSRVNHPNILKFLGAGYAPQRFLVLEWLGGGTLELLLKVDEVKPEILGFLKEESPIPKLTFSKAITYASELASTLSYLHSQCYPGATIIHRDLKPDNIAFTYDGKLKLLDFGLCACVKTRQLSSDTYEMTGNTGSLRYMAPEVVLCRPYTEKADVYSFAILVWQMASGEVPYDDIKCRANIVNRVALGKERPKLDKKWSPYFKRLLEACWHDDFEQRPSFTVIVAELQKLKNNEIKMQISLPNIKLPSLSNVLHRKETSRDYNRSL